MGFLEGLLISVLTMILDAVAKWLYAAIERYTRNNKIEGDAAADLADLKVKKAAMDAATGEARAKAQADFLAAASKFGRLRV